MHPTKQELETLIMLKYKKNAEEINRRYHKELNNGGNNNVRTGL